MPAGNKLKRGINKTQTHLSLRGNYVKVLRIVVCDDDQQDRAYYTSFCRKLGEKHNINMKIKEYTSGDSLLFSMEDPKFYSKVDIVFLDINMPGSNGIKVASEIRRFGYKGIIIFITVSDQHYEDAFDAEANNYVRKGKEFLPRFESVFLRAVRSAVQTGQDVAVFSCGGEYKQIKISDISHFEVNTGIVTVHYRNNKTFEFPSALTRLEDQLRRHDFQRVHRFYLVSLRYIKNCGYTELEMIDGTKIPIGRRYINDLKVAIKKRSQELE